MNTALKPYSLAGITLKNRIVMAPMTRARAHGRDATVSALNAEYYAQRASAGLIVSEGVQPSVSGQGVADTPGLHSVAQVHAWRSVTGAVHARGGRIFAQLMHSGRFGDPDVLPRGMRHVAPSEVAAAGTIHSRAGRTPLPVPHALTEDEISETIADFATAARNAIAAGFDGVEIHGANGYLVHQFLSTNVNLREDGWGGTSERRIRFAVDVTSAIADAIGAERTGIRLSPGNTLHDIVENDLDNTYDMLIAALSPMNLAYIHLMESRDLRPLTVRLRQHWPGTFILNPFTEGRSTGPTELALIEDGTADLIAYGALFIANPDTPARLTAGGPFTAVDPRTFFGGDHRGFTDYPFLESPSQEPGRGG